jgi:hypothetical protein
MNSKEHLIISCFHLKHSEMIIYFTQTQFVFQTMLGQWKIFLLHDEYT